MKPISSLIFLVLAALPASAAAPPPNFVIINIDDLGYADIGPYGSKLNRTPNLDRMAAEGRKLTAYYAAPVCSPSRASLMTGCYPKRVGFPQVIFPAEATGINASEKTLAELLKERGYATMCIGKWHLGDQPEFLPTRHGFDHYLGIPYSNDMGPAAEGARSSLGEPLPAAPKAGAKNKGKGKKEPRNHPPLPMLRDEKLFQRVGPKEQAAMVSLYTEEAVKFLQANRNGPFFLYLAHNAVHFPLYPGEAFQGKSKNGTYSDWVEEVDWSVGKVLDALRGMGIGGKTLVLFTSDNGGTPRAVNSPLRGFKGSTWEGGMREPTIAWWPGRIAAGTASGEITGMIDVLPTFVTLAGGQPPGNIDGLDAWPVFGGAPGAKGPHEAFYYFKGDKLEAVRSGAWKLDFKDGTKLYNLDEDIGETRDMSAGHADVAQRLRAIADKARADLGDGQPGPGCRPPGRVEHPQPIITPDGAVRAGFGP